MLSLTKDLFKKISEKNEIDLKPLTLCFWSEFTNNPAIMYGLFSSNSRKLSYNPEKVKVIGTKDGMVSQINILTMEDLDSFHEQILGVPLLLRIWVAFSRNDYVGESQPKSTFEKDMALLVDTSHPMIRPQLERAMDEARINMHFRKLFCVQIDFSEAIERWLESTYKRGCARCCRLSGHKATLYVTNFSKPNENFKCNLLWALLLGPCWLLSAPCYTCFRKCKCRDVRVVIEAPLVRRTVAANTGKIVEITKFQ